MAGAFDITCANGLVTLRSAPCACSQIELIAGKPRASRASLSGCSNHAICTSFCSFIHARERSPVPASCGSQISMLRPLARNGDAPASVPRFGPATYQRAGCGAWIVSPSSSISGLTTSNNVRASSSFMPERRRIDQHQMVMRDPHVHRFDACPDGVAGRSAVGEQHIGRERRFVGGLTGRLVAPRRTAARSSARAAACAGNPRRSRAHRALRGRAAGRARDGPACAAQWRRPQPMAARTAGEGEDRGAWAWA